MKHIVIVGAGVSGLALAYRLRPLASQVDITILESNSRPGGNAWTERRDGFQVEFGPNGFLDSKPTTTQLCRDLGLGDRLIAASETAGKNRYLFLDGRLRRLPGGLLDFLRSPLLSWRGKFDLIMERFRRNRSDGDESIAAFARRRAGREATEVLVDALVTGIHGGDAELLSMAAAFPRLAELERRHGSIVTGLGAAARERRAAGQPRTGKMWSFREGLRLMVEAMQDQVKPLLGVRVRRIDQQAAGWLVRGEGQDQWLADAVILACPAFQQAALLADLDRELAEQIDGIAYNRIAVVALGFKQAEVPRLDGFGYIAPQRTRRDLLGVQWCSTIFPDRAPPGHVLVRALCGGWHRADVVGWDDGRLTQAVRAELRLALGLTATPCFQHIVRWERGIPQYRLGHGERVRRIMTRAAAHPGLFLAGNAYHGVALNDCTEQAGLLAQHVAQFLSGLTK